MKAFKEMVEERAAGAAIMDSRLEVRFNRFVKKLRLPQPIRQMEFYERGVYLGWVDFAYPTLKLAIETDSWKWHFGRLAWERDKRKTNYLQRQGWRILSITWRQLKDEPEYVEELLRDFFAPSLKI